MTRIYCPYTDRDIEGARSSSEHIIPLALGGTGALRIRVDSAANSKVGSELDGRLADEFLWALRRTESGATGHSGKEPRAVIRHASYGEGDHRAQAIFHRKQGVRIWDVRKREYVRGEGQVRISTSMNVDLPVRFTAKVALAAGYFVHGDWFRQCVDHRQLREVMELDPRSLDLNKTPEELGLAHLTLTVDKWMDPVAQDPASDALTATRSLCSWLGGSTIVLMPGPGCFGVGVGLLGHYLAMVTVPADTAEAPNDGEYAWGHVLNVKSKKLRRYSLVDVLREWAEQLV